MNHKLVDLHPQFVAVGLYEHRSVDTLAEAQGIRFDCPRCIDSSGHQIKAWFKDRGVPDGKLPPGRWMVSGAGYRDLTLSPSIHLLVGCMWHGHVIGGEATNA